MGRSDRNHPGASPASLGPLVFNQLSPLRPGMIATNGVLHDGLLALIDEVAPGARR